MENVRRLLNLRSSIFTIRSLPRQSDVPKARVAACMRREPANLKKTIRLSLRPLLSGIISLLACTAFADLPSTAEMQETVSAAAKYEAGQSVEPFRRIEDWVRDSVANPGFRVQLETELTKLLGPDATFAARRFACEKLGIIGSGNALPTQ